MEKIPDVESFHIPTQPKLQIILAAAGCCRDTSSGKLDHPCTYRIQMDISDQLAQISVALAEDRLVSSLKDVADVPISPVIVLAVARQKPLHHAFHRLCLSLDQQVHMVRHHAIRVYIKPRPLLLLRK